MTDDLSRSIEWLPPAKIRVEFMKRIIKMKHSNPPTKCTGGRRAVDYDALYTLWKNDPNYQPIESFLEIYGIDPSKRRSKEATRNWRRTECAVHFETLEKNTWTKIRTWRTLQAEQDYLAADTIRELIATRVEDIKNSDHIETKEISALSICLERVQRIQRLSLGLSTDNVGVGEVRKSKSAHENIPTFVVEMNEDGKFKTQRPRLVQEE